MTWWLGDNTRWWHAISWDGCSAPDVKASDWSHAPGLTLPAALCHPHPYHHRHNCWYHHHHNCNFHNISSQWSLSWRWWQSLQNWFHSLLEEHWLPPITSSYRWWWWWWLIEVIVVISFAMTHTPLSRLVPLSWGALTSTHYVIIMMDRCFARFTHCHCHLNQHCHNFPHHHYHHPSLLKSKMYQFSCKNVASFATDHLFQSKELPRKSRSR